MGPSRNRQKTRRSRMELMVGVGGGGVMVVCQQSRCLRLCLSQ